MFKNIKYNRFWMLYKNIRVGKCLFKLNHFCVQKKNPIIFSRCKKYKILGIGKFLFKLKPLVFQNKSPQSYFYRVNNIMHIYIVGA